ncbi:hypothetical protein LG274_02640 [Micrococcus antarcticus]|uniref:hypothetical protein n=1 Tax=Micrococcus antarcticus TaxID=86171 RepID=UPI00384DFCE1
MTTDVSPFGVEIEPVEGFEPEDVPKHDVTPKRVPQCSATAKRSGQRCMRPVVPGASVCKFHGGNAPAVQKAARRRVLEASAAKDVALFGGRRELHPAQALLELVQSKAAEVAYWEGRVAEIDDHDALVWDEAEAERTESTQFGSVTRTIERAGAAVELQLLHDAQDALARYAAASLRAGVDAAMVELAKAQATQIVAVLQSALSDPRIAAAPDVARAVILDAVKVVSSG